MHSPIRARCTHTHRTKTITLASLMRDVKKAGWHYYSCLTFSKETNMKAYHSGLCHTKSSRVFRIPSFFWYYTDSGKKSQIVGFIPKEGYPLLAWQQLKPFWTCLQTESVGIATQLALMLCANCISVYLLFRLNAALPPDHYFFSPTFITDGANVSTWYPVIS